MSIGMSREEYWNGNDPAVLREYIEADKLRQERQNGEAWLQGMYIYDALETALSNAFSKKGTPPKRYAEKPYDLGIREKTAAEKQKEAKAQRMKMYLYLDGFAQKYKREHPETPAQ